MTTPHDTRHLRIAGPIVLASAAVALAGLVLAGGAALAEIDIGENQLAQQVKPSVSNIVRHSAKAIPTQEAKRQVAVLDPVLEEVKPTPTPAPDLAPVQQAAPDGVHVQCWQEGIKIIDEQGLSEMALSDLLPRATGVTSFDGNSLGLKGRDGGGGRFLVVSVREATCLVRDAS